MSLVKPSLFKTLLKHPTYLAVSLATMLSAIGTAFTSIAVYGELSARNAPVYLYSVTFILGVVPGLLTSFFGGRLANRINWGRILIGGELTGAFLLLVPIIGLKFRTLPLLLSVEFFGSAIAGFMVPVAQSFARRNFQNEELPVLASWSSLTFSAQFILGQFLGTLFYAPLGTKTYLLVDLLTYLFSAGVIVVALKTCPKLFAIENFNGTSQYKFVWQRLSPIQKKSFLLYPLLAMTCAPAMSLLPVLGANFKGVISFCGIALLPAVTLLFFKTLGQLLGPAVVNRFDHDKLLASIRLVPVCLLVYLACYLAASKTRSFGVAAGFVVVAHLASNIVYIIAYYASMRHFNNQEIAIVSSRQYQVSVLAMSFSAIWAAALMTRVSFSAVIGVGVLSTTLIYILLNRLEVADLQKKAELAND